jgi:DNA-binding transcriptional LysR family regulator
MSYLAYLRSFAIVYQYNSVSKACDTLHLTQPAVSKHIKALEEHLGRPLFVRLPRGLAPTPAAHELARQATPHLAALENLMKSGGDVGDDVAGAVHVGVCSGFSTLFCSSLPILARVGVRLDLRNASPPALVQALVDRSLDLAVTPARIPKKGIDYTLLYEGSLLLVCAPKWHAKCPKSGAPKGVPLIELQGPISSLNSYWRDAYDTDPDPATAIVPDYCASIDAARAAGGLAVIPECLIREALNNGQLIAVQHSRRKPKLSLYLARMTGVDVKERIHFVSKTFKIAATNW